MPDDALPQPWPTPAPLPVDTHRLERTFTNPLGQPLAGELKATAADRAEHGTAVIAAATFTVPVTAGLLQVDLPAGTYTFVGTLRTPDGNGARESFTVTLPE